MRIKTSAKANPLYAKTVANGYHHPMCENLKLELESLLLRLIVIFFVLFFFVDVAI